MRTGASKVAGTDQFGATETAVGGDPGAKTGNGMDQDTFLEIAAGESKKLGSLLRALSRAIGQDSKQSIVTELLAHNEQFVALCRRAGWPILATFSEAMNRMLRLFSRDPHKINASTLRTAANAVDFLTAVLAIAADLDSIERAPLRVLVIDDNDTCRRALALALTSENLQVFSASGGEEAMENLRQNDYDVIFTDIMMPEVNGFALLKRLRGLPNHTLTPVVFVTALSDFETRSRSILSGGCDLVAKPITPSEVLLKAFTFALRGRFPACRRRPTKAQAQVATAQAQVSGVVKLDERGTVQAINEEGAGMFGFKVGEILGIPIGRLFPKELQAPEHRERIPDLVRAPASAPAVRMVASRKNSSLLQLLVSSSPNSSEEARGLSLLLRYANLADVPKAREEQASTQQRHNGSGPRPQPVGSADLAQTLEAVQAQLRLQLQAHSTEARQLHDKIAVLEKEIADVRKRESFLEEEIQRERELRKRYEGEARRFERLVAQP